MLQLRTEHQMLHATVFLCLVFGSEQKRFSLEFVFLPGFDI